MTPSIRRADDLLFVGGCADLESLAQAVDDARLLDVISFHTDIREAPGVLEAAEARFGELPTWTVLGTTGLPDRGARISLRAIATTRESPLVFFSSRAEGELSSDPVEQARAAYSQAEEAVGAAGGTMADVIDIASFHLDPRGMVPCEQLHNGYWGDVPLEQAPAWTAIGAPALQRPGQLVQYRMIADLSDGPRIAKTPASLHWKHCPISGGTRKKGGSLIGIAGEVASDAEGNITTPGDTASQARYALNRIREVLEMHGGDMSGVVEITAFHKDHRAWEIVKEVAREYFDGDGPAWTSAGMTGLWNPGYLHEIYALAVV